MKIITALLAINLICLGIYHSMRVQELQSDLHVEQELYKACTTQNLWLTMQLEEVSQRNSTPVQ